MELNRREKIKKVALDIIEKSMPPGQEQDIGMNTSPERASEINEKLEKVLNLFEGDDQTEDDIDVKIIERKIAETGILNRQDSDEIHVPETSSNDVNDLVVLAQHFTKFQHHDDFKTDDTPYYGGFQIKDPALQAKLRSAATELVKSAGKKIMSGNFNLTTISFPIKCMSPKSLLQRVPDI